MIDLLLVEDRSEDAELTMLALQNAGFNGNLKWINDGVLALDFLFENSNQELVKAIKLIVLDINLPKINGLEILRKMKSSDFRRIPIVILTTSGELIDVSNAYDNYANSYIQKPVKFDDFQHYISLLKSYWLNINLVQRAD